MLRAAGVGAPERCCDASVGRRVEGQLLGVVSLNLHSWSTENRQKHRVRSWFRGVSDVCHSSFYHCS